MRKAIFIFIAIILMTASIDWIHFGITGTVPHDLLTKYAIPQRPHTLRLRFTPL